MRSSSNNVRSIAEYRQRREACLQCELFCLCFPATVADGWRHLEDLALRQRMLGRGEFLHMAGDTLRGLVVLRRGSLKRYQISAEGDALVTGFYVPGEAVGINVIDSGAFDSFAVALDELEYCEIPLPELRRLQDSSREVRRALEHLLCRRLVIAERQLMMIRHQGARARVAMFLLDMSSRLTGPGRSGRVFRLGMDRHDIGSYLGLTIGTVSRAVSQFQRAGLLTAHGKAMRIVDRRGLLQVAAPHTGMIRDRAG